MQARSERLGVAPRLCPRLDPGYAALSRFTSLLRYVLFLVFTRLGSTWMSRMPVDTTNVHVPTWACCLVQPVYWLSAMKLLLIVPTAPWLNCTPFCAMSGVGPAPSTTLLRTETLVPLPAASTPPF